MKPPTRRSLYASLLIVSLGLTLIAVVNRVAARDTCLSAPISSVPAAAACR